MYLELTPSWIFPFQNFFPNFLPTLLAPKYILSDTTSKIVVFCLHGPWTDYEVPGGKKTQTCKYFLQQFLSFKTPRLFCLLSGNTYTHICVLYQINIYQYILYIDQYFYITIYDILSRFYHYYLSLLLEARPQFCFSIFFKDT